MPDSLAHSYGGTKPARYGSIDEAFEAARRDKNIWKITWTSLDGEYVSFIRIAETRSKILWAKTPMTIAEH